MHTLLNTSLDVTVKQILETLKTDRDRAHVQTVLSSIFQISLICLTVTSVDMFIYHSAT